VRCPAPAPTSRRGCRTRSARSSQGAEKFGTGHVEGIVESGSANNSALAGAWIPALVFGIPGDSITAIVIGVLYMKNMNPGPSLFTNNPQNIYAVYLLFIIANIIMIPARLVVHQGRKQILQGAAHRADADHHAVLRRRIVRDQQTAFDVTVMLVAGIAATCSRTTASRFAPAILGVVLGGMLEENLRLVRSSSRTGDLRVLHAAGGGDACRPHARGVVPAHLMERLRRLAGPSRQLPVLRGLTGRGAAR
jgi:TctA family transporter